MVEKNMQRYCKLISGGDQWQKKTCSKEGNKIISSEEKHATERIVN
jgi:hypothetical protein